MKNRADLKLDWCSYQAAKYACLRWHYSRCMPVGKLVKIGVWENGRFIGCVLFGRGAVRNIGKPFGLIQTEICELVRVALDSHETPVTRIVSLSLKILKKANPGIQVVVSYADPRYGHLGKIYQAGNWIYLGQIRVDRWVKIKGKTMHLRSAGSKYGSYGLAYLHKYVDPEAEYVLLPKKHKYIMPLGKIPGERLRGLSRPYPKKPCDSSVNGSTSAFQAGGGGSNPTLSLQDIRATVEHG